MIKLPNYDLISKKIELVYEPNRKDYYLVDNDYKYYYGTVVKKDWEVNKDYTAVGKELFFYLSENFKCKRQVIR